jgi:hypothetical protein
MIRKIVKEIDFITNFLVDNNLLLDYNKSIVSNNKICWSSDICMIEYMKLDNLYEFYKNSISNKEYSFLLDDGSFMQIYYEFKGKELSKHRLMFFNFGINKDNMFEDGISLLEQLEEFETIEAKNLFVDVRLLKDFGFVRFDYDKDAFKENIHPYSHCTINQEGVRIPVKSALAPIEFVEFILKHYYHKTITQRKKQIFFPDTICTEEKKLLYFGKNND